MIIMKFSVLSSIFFFVSIVKIRMYIILSLSSVAILRHGGRKKLTFKKLHIILQQKLQRA